MASRIKMFGKKEQTKEGSPGLRTIEKTETITYPDGSTKTVITRTTTSSSRNGDAFESFPKDMMNGFKADDSKPKAGRGNRDINGKADDRNGTTPKQGPSSAAPAGSFAEQSTNVHNKYRAMHGAPPLQWSNQLAKDAEKYAKELARKRTLKHSSKQDRGDAGENLAMFTGKFDRAADEATDMWYSEVEKYDFKRGGWQGGTGHFTQVVWKESKELGLGRAESSDGCTYVVGRYRPAGNMINVVNENVFPKTR